MTILTEEEWGDQILPYAASSDPTHKASVLVLREHDREQRAEIKKFKNLYGDALDCVDMLFQPGGQPEDPILPDFCRAGESKFDALLRLGQDYLAQRAEIERLSEELYRLKEQSALGAAGATRNQISLEAEVQTWKDNHGLVVSDRDTWRARAEKAEAEYNAAYQTVLHLSARADRYLTAMRTLVEEADSSQDRLLIADRLAESLPGIRTIVEEARRG